jgi:uncharacterized phage-like protein YoqJ
MEMGMRDKTCCFTGHQTLPQNERSEVQARLYIVLQKLIEKGIQYFGSGGAMGFDLLAAEVVLELRKWYPHIRLIMVLPYENQERGWDEEEVRRYHTILEQANKVVYLQREYRCGCMLRRNRYLVDNSRGCVAYCTRVFGGTAYTVNYAKRVGIPILYI